MLNIKTTNTILYCKKWKETVAFYQTRLGLPILMSHDWFIEFKLNEESRLSIADEARASIDSNQGKGVTISLKVDDIKDIHSILTKAGVNPTPVKNHSWGAKVIYIHDPEGNRIEFWATNREAFKNSPKAD